MEKAASIAVVCVITLIFCITSCVANTSGIYIDNELDRQSVLVKRIPHSQKGAIKQEILNLLGLDKKPKPNAKGTKYSAPHYMLDLYNTLEVGSLGDLREEEEEYMVRRHIQARNLTLPGMEDRVGKADMIMSFVHHSPKDNIKLRHQASRRYYFDFKEVPSEQVIIGAELRLFKKANKADTTYKINIYNIKVGSDISDRVLELEVNTTVYSDYEGWVEFNMTDLARHWNFFPANNLGLYMTITDSKENDVDPRDAGLIGKKGAEDKQPFLVAFFKALQEVRVRHSRGAGRKKRKNLDTSTAMQDEPFGFGSPNKHAGKACQMKTLFVSFRDLQWQEWIIAPEGYSAFYCQGECSFPLNIHMNATNHAIVQTLVHLMNPFGVPKPSCAPTKLTPISVLYFDDSNNVILKKYKNMVVRACGCH
jgi:hypothetical protein